MGSDLAPTAAAGMRNAISGNGRQCDKGMLYPGCYIMGVLVLPYRLWVLVLGAGFSTGWGGVGRGGQNEMGWDGDGLLEKPQQLQIHEHMRLNQGRPLTPQYLKTPNRSIRAAAAASRTDSESAFPSAGSSYPTLPYPKLPSNRGRRGTGRAGALRGGRAGWGWEGREGELGREGRAGWAGWDRAGWGCASRPDRIEVREWLKARSGGVVLCTVYERKARAGEQGGGRSVRAGKQAARRRGENLKLEDGHDEPVCGVPVATMAKRRRLQKETSTSKEEASPSPSPSLCSHSSSTSIPVPQHSGIQNVCAIVTCNQAEQGQVPELGRYLHAETDDADAGAAASLILGLIERLDDDAGRGRGSAASLDRHALVTRKKRLKGPDDVGLDYLEAKEKTDQVFGLGGEPNTIVT
ncbi:hypothetical protein GALMADRAFT_217258 [Galerina marginata CBS 339.88]|uniref:Uncharacterized protein n=1 Tax=Galerina marginata (strain CBS 339.88) TaxID=685588 RepID=A0A067SH29_GALM3|nr:hypothetical protein GALMADRAFT_217258 [Galerina marginata CBS 339.88]